MTYHFRSYNVIYIVYGIQTKIVGHYLSLVTRYSLLRIQTPEIIFYLLFKQFKFYTPAQNQGGALLACSFDIEPRFRILATRPFFLGTGKATIFLE